MDSADSNLHTMFVALMWIVRKLYNYVRNWYSLGKASEMTEYENIDDFPKELFERENNC